VTEEVTDTNLIRMQFDAAMGKPLALKQSDVRIKCHAVEVRLCAEDPADGFKPQQGDGCFTDADSNLRIDGGYDSQTAYINIPADYDSLVAKIIARGSTRAAAIASLRKGLDRITFNGVRTNRNFLLDILDAQEFKESRIDVAWLSRRAPYQERLIDGRHGQIAALLLARRDNAPWRSTGPARTILKLRERGEERTFVVEGSAIGSLAVGKAFAQREWIWADIMDDGAKRKCSGYLQGSTIHVGLEGDSRDALFEDVTYAPAEPKGAAGANVVRAPMAGRIVKVLTELGAKVAKDQVLVILEAMKMEHELRAAFDGVVQSVSVKPGDQASIRQALVTLSPA
jgi:geranyl-CoA carboxylase alpha subunit